MKPADYYAHMRTEMLALIPREASCVLDVGCGSGRIGESIKRRQNAIVYGIEIDKTAAAEAATKLDRIWNAPVEDVIAEIADETLDCIITADVLEHLVDPWAVLRQLQKKLKLGGTIVASIPNVQHWSVAKQLIEGSWRYEITGLLDISHIRFFTRRSIYELFSNAGLKIASVGNTTNGPGASKKILRALAKAGLKTDSLAQDSHVYQYLVVAERPKPAEDTPKVSIIILNWNGLADTLECLESVRKIDYQNFEIVVVDNGSTDGSPQEIREQFPDITVIETGKNLGFAEGNNVGIRHALAKGADYLFLLNNDTIVDPRIVQAFIEATQLCPEGSVLGAKIYYYSEPDKVWYAGAKWDSSRLSFTHVGWGETENGNFSQIKETDYACGCAFFAPAQVFRNIGFLDSRFFLTYEECDFCFRAQGAGYKSFFVPQAKLWHKISTSFGGQESPVFAYFMARNRLLWAKKNLPVAERLRLVRLVSREMLPKFGMSKTAGYSLFRKLYWSIVQYRRELKKRYEAPVFRAKAWGIRDYFLGRYGDCPPTVRKLASKSAATSCK